MLGQRRATGQRQRAGARQQERRRGDLVAARDPAFAGRLFAASRGGDFGAFLAVGLCHT